MMVVENEADSGNGTHGNITWAALSSQSQSLVSSLLVNLLISLSRLWHWFQHLWVSEEETIFDEDQAATKTLVDDIDNNGNKSLITIEKDFLEETVDGNDNSSIESNAESDTITEEKSTAEVTPEDNMTIEVSVFDDANPEHGAQECTESGRIGKKFSLPIALRLNSESLEVSSDQDEELLMDFNGKGSHKIPQAEDSCSGYCSGSGSSLPGSPIPNSCMKQLQHNLSSDEHENETFDGHEEVTPFRRDSDTSDSSETGETSPETVARIVAQVESMFSDDHLAKDGFLLKHVRRRSDGFVSLKLVAGLRKVKQISRDFTVVLNALKTSDKLEVNTEGTKVRRQEPLTPALKSMPIKQAKKDKNDVEKNQAEKENQASNHNHTNGSGNGNYSLTDEQQIARKRRQKGDRLNELQYERGPVNQHYNKSQNSGRSSFSSTTEDGPLRRRGGSLPIPASLMQHRGSTAGNYLYPNASPPNASAGFLRPKSNSYSEGTDPTGATMSTWLQRRKASAASSRLSSGDISLSGVLRQPRGPDGTKGFHPGYLNLIMEERLQREMAQQLSVFAS